MAIQGLPELPEPLVKRGLRALAEEQAQVEVQRVKLDPPVQRGLPEILDPPE
jgi:hypothetical protein